MDMLPHNPRYAIVQDGDVPLVGPSHQYLNGLVCSVYKVDARSRTRWRAYMPRTAVGLALSSARHKSHDLNVLTLTIRSAAGSETETEGLGDASPSRP